MTEYYEPYIYKKGERTEYGSHRGMSLLSHSGKVYYYSVNSRIIDKQLWEHIKLQLRDWQHGFRIERSSLNLNFTIKIMMAENWKCGDREVYHLYFS